MVGAVAGACHGMGGFPAAAVDTVRKVNRLHLGPLVDGCWSCEHEHALADQRRQRGDRRHRRVAGAAQARRRRDRPARAGPASAAPGSMCWSRPHGRAWPAAYAGAHGTGPFGELVRAALQREGIACCCRRYRVWTPASTSRSRMPAASAPSSPRSGPRRTSPPSRLAAVGGVARATWCTSPDTRCCTRRQPGRDRRMAGPAAAGVRGALRPRPARGATSRPSRSRRCGSGDLVELQLVTEAVTRHGSGRDTAAAAAGQLLEAAGAGRHASGVRRWE